MILLKAFLLFTLADLLVLWLVYNRSKRVRHGLLGGFDIVITDNPRKNNPND